MLSKAHIQIVQTESKHATEPTCQPHQNQQLDKAQALKHDHAKGSETSWATYRVLTALALAVVVVDVDRVLQIGRGSRDFHHRVHHQVQHVLAVLESISLAPSHVLQCTACTISMHAAFADGDK